MGDARKLTTTATIRARNTPANICVLNSIVITIPFTARFSPSFSAARAVISGR